MTRMRCTDEVCDCSTIICERVRARRSQSTHVTITKTGPVLNMAVREAEEALSLLGCKIDSTEVTGSDPEGFVVVLEGSR